mmetsp:Transcript_11882/g.18254  ORF Transcript_11882/g.18254 Transcript_11882/m.18254 type:complete len:923 (-) Transcript_11882:185-2953(-)
MDEEEHLDQLISISTLLQNYIPLQDRTHKQKLYPSCFIASEAVDLLMKHGEVESREEAVDCLNTLMTTGVPNDDYNGGVEVVLFEHVRKSRRGREFEDDDQLYQFVDHTDDQDDQESSSNNNSEVASEKAASEDEDLPIMDKYGFLIDDQKRFKEVESSHHSEETNQSEQDGTTVPLEQWQELFDKATSSKGNKLPSKLHDKIKHSTRRGLPDSLRRRAWTVFTGVDQIMSQSKGQYKMLLKQADFEWSQWIRRSSINSTNGGSSGTNNSVSELSGLTTDNDPDNQLEEYQNKRPSHVVLEQIERDICRTFPNHYLFQTIREDEDDMEKATGSGQGGGDTANNEIEPSNSVDVSEGENSVADEIKRELNSMVERMNGGSSTVLTKSTMLIDVNGISVAKIDGENDTNAADVDSNSMTIPSTSKLSERGDGQGALRRILRAYSQYDNEVGYCQGMNFIVAMFLTFLSEEESFWLLVVVMNEDRYMLRALYGEDMSGTHEILYIADKLMKQFVPKLWKHLEREGIHNSMFVTQWLLTLYTSSFPFDLVSRVWDSFLVEGWKVIYRVMLGLLKHAEPTLLEMPFEQILMFLREFPTMINGQTIMRESLQIGLKRRHVQKHVNAWRVANPTEAGATKNVFSRKDSNSSWTNDSNNSDGNDQSKKAKSKSKFLIPNAFRKKAEKDIVVEDLGPKLLPIVGSTKFAVLIHNALTPDECKQLIERAEKGGFDDASIYDRRSNRIHRKCQRWYEDDTALAADWYERILNALDDTAFEYKIRNAPWMGRRYNATALPIRSVGINERLRVLKYSQGEYFGSHCDTKFVRGPNYGDKAGETSHVSVQVYLNDRFKGGQTRFHGGGRHFDVKPKTGSILIFDHNLLHQGAVIKAGKKYVVRTDVMYRKMRTRGDEMSSLSGLPDVVGLDLRQTL